MKPIKLPLDDYKSFKSVVPVFTIGKLAVHYTINNLPERGWTVTHIPTGYAIRTAIKNKRKAITLAKLYTGAMDWDFTDPNSPKVKDQGALIRYIHSIFPY